MLVYPAQKSQQSEAASSTAYQSASVNSSAKPLNLNPHLGVTMTTLIFTTLISLATAEPTQEAPVTFIDFDEVSLTGELVKPSLTLIKADRPPAQPDLLIPDLRQFVLDVERAKAADKVK